ncbi:MAG: NAD-binding protein [Armatimonadetes bacterium]|nr:NAD-binding protein [Armatimonadota bacterium]
MKPVPTGLYGSRSNPFVLVPLVLLVTILVCAVGYMVLGAAEGQEWSVFDCIYFTVISLTTVGYGETLPSFAANLPARAYTIVVLIVGYGVIVWAASSVIALFVEGRLGEALGRRRMMNEIEKVSGHYLVCGLGETGLQVQLELRRTARRVVLVERDADRIQLAMREGPVLFVQGDAEEEETLLAAGIERAVGVIACLPSDKDNIYLVLSARQLNPELRIVARYCSAESRDKLLRAGADVVISPNVIGGLRIASEMIRPHVTTFLDVMLREQTKVIRLDEVTVGEDSPLCNRTIGDAQIHRQTGLLVIATRQVGVEGFTYNPGPEQRLVAGTVLIVLGHVDNIARLRRLVALGSS